MLIDAGTDRTEVFLLDEVEAGDTSIGESDFALDIGAGLVRFDCKLV